MKYSVWYIVYGIWYMTYGVVGMSYYTWYIVNGILCIKMILSQMMSKKTFGR